MNITENLNSFWQANEWLIHSALNKSYDFCYDAAVWCRIASANPPPVESGTFNTLGRPYKRVAFLIIGAGCLTAYLLYRQRNKAKLVIEKFEPGVVYLFTHQRSLGVPSHDFTELRLETWLRMSDIDYQIVVKRNIPFIAPYKIPFLEYNGQMASTAEELSRVMNREESIDSHLKPEQKAIDRAVDFLIEYSLVPCSSPSAQFILTLMQDLWTYIRWAKNDPESRSTDTAIARADLKALAAHLGTKHYLSGLKPTKADASAFAALALILCGHNNQPLCSFIDDSCPNLRDYFERIKGKVYLFQYPPLTKIPNLSPYCLKLENWLRMSGINYANVENLPIMHRSTEGTLPYVELNGEIIADSAFIIQKLPEKLNIQSSEDRLSAEQKSTSLAFERLIENSLFLGTAKYRYEHFEEIFAMWPKRFGVLQPLFNKLIKRMLNSKLNEKLVVNGMGRHSSEDIMGIVTRDLDAVSVQLGDKPFLMGEFPTKVDSSLFAAIALITFMPFDTPVKTYIQKNCQNLEQFAIRIREKYWPDFEKSS